jgi:hypothetical protein
MAGVRALDGKYRRAVRKEAASGDCRVRKEPGGDGMLAE